MRLLLLAAIFCSVPAASADEEFFSSQIEPLLRKRCFECHSHNARELNGGLTLDSRSGWAEGGDSGPAIVPGDPDNSLLMRMVRWSDAEHQMPPDAQLPPDEVALLEDWIKRGAVDPRVAAVSRTADDWWSLKPLRSPPVPSDGHPIDVFITSRLIETGLSKSPPADRRTLLRRASFDLHGLPPSADAVRAFAANGDPAAWEQLVDEMLASPRYGERWARHWLDTIHYADSHGFEHDEMRPNAWRFRDYVIESFNRDLPWAEFIRQQLAADVVCADQPQVMPALGFLGAGPYDRSAAATAPMAYEYLDRDDLVTQTMAGFVSTTANCARCHAHKFDPISQEDYFALQAVFAGIGKGDIRYDADPDTARRRRRWTELRDAAVRVDPAVLMSPNNLALVRDWEAQRGPEPVWRVLHPESFVSVDGSTLERLDDGSIRSSGPRPDKETIVVTGRISDDFTGPIAAIRIELLPDDSLPMRGPGRQDNGNLHLSEVELQHFASNAAQPMKILLQRAVSDFDQQGFPVTTIIDGDLTTSWAIHPDVGRAHQAVIELAAAVELTPESRLTVTLRAFQGGGHLIGRFRILGTSTPAASVGTMPEAVAAALAVPSGERTDEQVLTIAAHALRQTAEAKLEALPPMDTVWAAGRTATNERGEITMSEPRPIHLLRRGDLDKPGDEIAPGSLSAIIELPARFPLADPKQEASRRAALADWIADERNPLTWRSIVNRVWHYHFGRGLVDTPSDFGRMGGVPSHPELLDWLAVWFRDEAHGSLKQLHRLIMTSRTYQQASASNETAAAIDPDNRLLWRMNRLRLDADSYRDAVLSVTGRLDLTTGGPGDQHFTTTPGPQVTPVLHYDEFDLNSPAAARRSIYRVVVRGSTDPFLDTLDFPDMGLLTPVRGFSASPLQALTLFNNRFVLHHSEVLAQRAEREIGEAGDVVSALFQITLQRPATPEELSAFQSLATEHGLAAAARVLLNSNEFLFVE